MNVLFLTSADLKESKYKREGNKNLLVTKFGTGDTIGICGKVVDIEKTKFGVMITLEDKYGNIVVTAGTFNKNALEDAKDILKKFNEVDEIYLLLYANPFYKEEKIYLNANQDFCIFEVDKKFYEEFNNIREKSIEHIYKKLEKEEQEFEENIDPYSFGYISELDLKILKLVKNLSKGKKIKIADVVENLKKEEFLKDINVEDKIYELMEKGYFYEPRPGYLKVV